MTPEHTTKEIIELWQKSLSGVVSYSTPKIMFDYIYHTTIVAKAAQKIAEKSGLNPEKAFFAVCFTTMVKYKTKKPE